jgi:hypothetical protein
MTGEVTIPLLPCASIDAVEEFYAALGFRRTYRQTRPNPYLSMRREDIELGFFGMDGFQPEDSYGSCIVTVADTGELHRSFAEGLRAAFGKVPLAGIPRMTRPRKRKNVDNLAGFSVIDPGGNWIRIFPAKAEKESDEPGGKLADAVANAVVMADSHGDPAQAAKILDGALRRLADAPAVERVEALAYRAEIAVTLGDLERMRATLAELHAVELTDAERDQVAATLAAANELAADQA